MGGTKRREILQEELDFSKEPVPQPHSPPSTKFSFSYAVPGLCGPIIKMLLGFFPIPHPRIRKTLLKSNQRVPHSCPWLCAWRGGWRPRRRGRAAVPRPSRFALRGGPGGGSGATGRSPSALRRCRGCGPGLRLGQEQPGRRLTWSRWVLERSLGPGGGTRAGSGQRTPPASLLSVFVPSDPTHIPRVPGSAPFLCSAVLRSARASGSRAQPLTAPPTLEDLGRAPQSLPFPFERKGEGTVSGC